MKKKNRFTLIALGLLAGVFVASGCTANFVTSKEKARVYYLFEPGVSTFYVEENPEIPAESTQVSFKDTNIVQTYTYDPETNHFENKKYINSIIDAAKTNGTLIPDVSYFAKTDELMLESVLNAKFGEGYSAKTDYSQEEVNDALKEFGYLKFYNKNGSMSQFNENLTNLRATLGWEKCPTSDFLNYYKNSLKNSMNSYKSFITTKDGHYGTFGNDNQPIEMEAVTWGDAWNKGFIEGLIVYPVAWLVDVFANLFAHGNQANFTNGLPQILSLILVTVIVRLFLFLVTIKSTLSQQKMNQLQPELAKIQQKYPNSNTSQSQKQRLAEEQMRLYKKNKVNPLSSLLVLIVQFPIFIGVWGAMTGSAVLSTGTFLKLDLSQSIWECLKLGPARHAGWWTALVLILLMSAGQFFSMKVPQWIQKAKTKKVSRLAKNPAEKSQNRTANIVSYVMLIMIIFMGFTLPAAMGVYWFIGALVSLLQTLIINLVTNRKTAR